VGAFREERNAIAVYNRLVQAGFTAYYARNQNYRRFGVTGIGEREREDVARRLGAAGFFEVLFREE
jgi:hypothetical protein